MIHRHRYTVDDYYRMAESGILAPDARVELIEGEIVDMPPIGAPHAALVTMLQNRLIAAIGARALARIQNPIRLDSRNEPEPDIALVRNRSGHYRDRHPGPADVLLLVEVADSSLRYDRDVKMALYARFGIPETWLVNLADATLTAFRAPGPQGYAMAERLRMDSPIPVPGLEGLSVDLTDLF
nr:Uma2 family endonuclease [Thiorhodococcus mannitoliphagus]